MRPLEIKFMEYPRYQKKPMFDSIPLHAYGPLLNITLVHDTTRKLQAKNKCLKKT